MSDFFANSSENGLPTDSTKIDRPDYNIRMY